MYCQCAFLKAMFEGQRRWTKYVSLFIEEEGNTHGNYNLQPLHGMWLISINKLKLQGPGVFGLISTKLEVFTTSLQAQFNCIAQLGLVIVGDTL